MKKIYYFYSLLLTALFLLPWSGLKADPSTLTVAEGTDENSYNPVYTYNADTQGGISQIIYPASLLSNLENGTITAVKFYAKSNLAWNGSGYSSATIPTFEVRITETTSASFSSTAALTTVPNTASYSGQPTKDVDYLLFNLATPYEYQGGNLLIEVKIATAGQWQSTVKFYGVNQTNNQCYYNSPGYSGASGCSAFLPKTTFTYNPGEAPACPKPKNLHVDAILPDGASIAWEQKGTETVYQWACVETGESVTAWNDLAENDRTYTIHGLTAGTVYDFYVRSNCGDGESNKSEFAKQSFTPECAAPENVRTTAKGTTSATLAWDEVNGISKYQFVCVRKNGTPNWDGVAEQSGLSVGIDTLVPGISYDFYVRSYFNGSIQSAASKLNFVTAFALPVVQNFESTEFPAGWTKSNQWTLYNYSGYGHNSDGTMRYTSSATSDLTLPEIAITEPAQISFWRQSSYVSCSVYVNDGTTTTSLGSFAKNSSWKKDSVDLSAYVGQTITLIIRGNYYSGSRYLYIDDIAVTYKKVDAPTSLAADPTATGAVVTWNSTEGTKWNLRYREYNAEPEADWIEVNNLTAKTCTLTVADATKTYEVQVKTICSENRKSEWTASATFAPESCPTVTGVSYGEKTYNSVVVNWTATSSSTWALRYKAVGDADYTVASSTISELTYNLTGLTTNVAYTVEVKPAACGDWVAAATTYTPTYPSMGTVTVSDITETGASATWADVTGATGYEYVIMEGETAADWTGPTAATSPAALSGLAAGTNYTIYVRAKFGEGRSAEASKNFTTSTVAPTALTQGATTQNSIAFSWSYAGAATQFQWKSSKEGSVWSDPISVLTATETGLAAGTTYTFYVRAYYSATVQSAELTGSFDTECGTASLPFSQDFGNSGTTKPNCWTIANWGTSGNYWTLASDFSQTGNALRYNARTSSSCHATSPSIALDDKAELKFYVRNYYYYYSAYYISGKVVITDGVTVKEVEYGNNSSLTQKTVDLSEFAGKTVTITFQGNGATTSTNAYLWIDDVTITYKPIDAPTDLTAEAGDASATISWTDDAEAGPWDIQYRAYKAEEPYESWSTPISSASKSYNLTGLTNGTEYEVQVRTHCSENRISAWTASQTFTPVACATVSEVTFGAATYNSVVVNWTANANSTWELQYKAGEGDWTTASNAIDALTYTLNGLTTETAYSVRVKANCAEDWVEAATTFTPAYTAPANAAVASITDAAAAASWDAVADAEGYKYIVVEAGETPNWASATATDELSAALSGLAGLSDYDFYVAAVYCDHVEAAAPVNFQTVAVAPTDLTQGATTTNSIAFSWSYAGAATQFQWKSSKEGSNWSEPISATNAEETGLAGGTSYTIYVRAYYADGKYSSELSETFGTECAVLALPFSQDFEDGVSPLCWSAATAYSDYYDYDGNYGWKVTADNDGNYVMRFKSGTSMTMPALTLPQIDLTATPAVLSFKVRNVYSNKTVAGNVTVSAEGVEDLVTALTTSSSLTEQRIDLTTFAGKRITIKFQATSNAASGRIDLDDIRILEQLTLADDVDNTGTLNTYMGKAVDLTLGRTFICADYYNTICLPFDLSAEELAASPIATTDLWAFKYARVEGGELLIRIIEADHINAGEPYLIAWPAGEPIVNPLFKNVIISASAGKMMGEENLKFVGILKPETFAAHDDSKLFLYENNTLYWWNGDAESHLYSFRAFFTVEGGAGSSPIKNIPARIIKHDQTATDIETAGNKAHVLKLIENNQVIIIRNSVKYTIQGQKIQ